MNRKEFIDKLRAELSKLPADEVNAAIEYYEEYFDEAGPEKEQEIIKELGSPKKVAGQIKSEYAVKMLDAEEKPTAKKGLSAIWWIIIGICSAPISIPVAICMVVFAICVFATAIACVIGVFAAIVGCTVAAIACVIFGFMAIPVAFPTALLSIGLGLCGLGTLAALSVAIVIGLRAAITATVRAMRKRNERKRLEKMNAATHEQTTANNDWSSNKEQSNVKDAYKSDKNEPAPAKETWKHQGQQTTLKDSWNAKKGEPTGEDTGWKYKTDEDTKEVE